MRVASVLLGWLLLSAIAVADDDLCLSCHAGLTDAAGHAVAADLERWNESLHGSLGIACVDCHLDLDGAAMPHADRLQPARCDGCHVEPSAGQARGSHAALACSDCHGAHDMLSAADPQSAIHHFAIPQLCSRCHGTPEDSPERPSPFEDGIHGEALLDAGLLVAPTCVTCHGSHDVRPSSDPQSPTHRSEVTASCGSCHAGLLRLHRDSVHGRAVEADGTGGASCVDCHAAHGIASTEADAWQLAVVEECGACHEQSLKTYQDTFHGQIKDLGFVRVAKCADCHGAHDILALDHPDSRVSAAHVVETCKSCHPGATANYASYDPHADADDVDRNPAVFWAKRGMQLLLTAVFAFFFLHTGLWLPRELLERWGRRGGDE